MNPLVQVNLNKQGKVTPNKQGKVTPLNQAVASVKAGSMIGLGGNVLHRAPMAFVRELVRQQVKDLRAVKTAGAHDIDTLARGGCLKSVDAGFISYETTLGLAKYYRRAVESGRIIANEHACYTVMCALRAATMGLGFMPVKGMIAGDLLEKAPYFQQIRDPFTGEPTTVVKALVPDVVVLHVHLCDEGGNALIEGPLYDDPLLFTSGKRVILTTEKLVDSQYFTRQKLVPTLAGFLVDQVVVVPGGAKPTSMHRHYEADFKALHHFLQKTTEADFQNYLSQYQKNDRQGGSLW